MLDGSSADGRDANIAAGDDVAAAFVLGVAARDILGQLPRFGVVYTSSLEDEALLIAAGFCGRYIYRGREKAFDRAAGLALAWLTELGGHTRKAGEGAELLFGDTVLPAWTLSYDALFEIKGGIFDSIFHFVLAEEICTTAPGLVHVFAAKDDQLGAAVVQLLGARACVEWQEPCPSLTPTVDQPLVKRLWRRIDSLIIHPLLVGLRSLWEGRRRHSRIAIVGTSGSMARLNRDGCGRLCVRDVYYENLEPSLEVFSPDVLKVGISPPRLTGAIWKDSFLIWYLILSGAFRPWSAYATPRDVLAVFRERRRYRKVLAVSDNNPRFRALFQAGGLNFYSLLRPRLFEMLPNILAASHFHHAVAERLVNRENIDLVISVESFSNLGRCLASALHRKGGQLWGIQGGIISPRMVTNTGFYVPALGGRNELMADLFFTWGSAYSALLERFGIPAERMRLMGFNRAKRRPEGMAKQKNMRIVYITGGNAMVCPYLMTSEEEYFTLSVLADCLPLGAELLVRTHPRHNAEDFRQRLSGRPNIQVSAAAEMSLEECLASSSCIVGKASTVLLEAAQAGLPVLIINLSGAPDFTGFIDGPTPLPYATDSSGLRRWLASILTEEKTETAQGLENFVDAWCAGGVDSATAALLSELEKWKRGAS